MKYIIYPRQRQRRCDTTASIAYQRHRVLWTTARIVRIDIIGIILYGKYNIHIGTYSRVFIYGVTCAAE